MNKAKIDAKYLENTKKYKDIFDDEIKKIMSIPKMPKCDFIHIGSTSFNNSYGRECVDVLVIVENLHEITTFDEKRLNNISYHRVNHGVRGMVKYNRFTNLLTLEYDVSLYVVQKDTKTYNDFINFQNLLLDKTYFEKFILEKKNLVEKFSTNIKEYNKRKDYFIKNIIKKEIKND